MTIGAIVLLYIAFNCYAIRFGTSFNLRRGNAIPLEHLLDGVESRNAKNDAETDAHETIAPFGAPLQSASLGYVQGVCNWASPIVKADFIASMLQSDISIYNEEIRKSVQDIASQVFQSDEMQYLFWIPLPIDWFQKLRFLFEEALDLVDLEEDMNKAVDPISTTLENIRRGDISIPGDAGHNVIAFTKFDFTRDISEISYNHFKELWRVMSIVGFPRGEINPRFVRLHQKIFFDIENAVFEAIQTAIRKLEEKVDAIDKMGTTFSELSSNLMVYAESLKHLMPFSSIEEMNTRRDTLASADADQVLEYFKTSFNAIFRLTALFNQVNI